MESAAQLPVITTSAWERGPAHPSLAQGVVDVWRADLRRVDDAVLRWLSDDERERAARILNRSKGVLWARSRGVLRELLGRYTGISPGAIALAPGPGGKPELKAGQGADLHFNLSHSGWLALFAFGSDGPVGVDVESERAPRDLPEGFLRAWTRGEALAKCRSEGIGVEPALASWGRLDSGAEDVCLGDLDLGPDAMGAVAASGPPACIRCFLRIHEGDR